MISADGLSVSFLRQESGLDVLYVSTWNGSSWGTPEQVSAPGEDVNTGTSYYPQLSETGTVAAWIGDAPDDTMRVARKVGGTWQTPVTVSTDEVQTSSFDLSLDGSYVARGAS